MTGHKLNLLQKVLSPPTLTLFHIKAKNTIGLFVIRPPLHMNEMQQETSKKAEVFLKGNICVFCPTAKIFKSLYSKPLQLFLK
jgi:hypothetical protein